MKEGKKRSQWESVGYVYLFPVFGSWDEQGPHHRHPDKYQCRIVRIVSGISCSMWYKTTEC